MEANEVKYVIIGSKITELEDGLFEQMTNLEKVDFSEVPGIDLSERCFKGCTNLKTVTF